MYVTPTCLRPRRRWRRARATRAPLARLARRSAASRASVWCQRRRWSWVEVFTRQATLMQSRLTSKRGVIDSGSTPAALNIAVITAPCTQPLRDCAAAVPYSPPRLQDHALLPSPQVRLAPLARRLPLARRGGRLAAQPRLQPIPVDKRCRLLRHGVLGSRRRGRRLWDGDGRAEVVGDSEAGWGLLLARLGIQQDIGVRGASGGSSSNSTR